MEKVRIIKRIRNNKGKLIFKWLKTSKLISGGSAKDELHCKPSYYLRSGVIAAPNGTRPDLRLSKLFSRYKQQGLTAFRSSFCLRFCPLPIGKHLDRNKKLKNLGNFLNLIFDLNLKLRKDRCPQVKVEKYISGKGQQVKAS